uniref:T-complex protein 1 subunit alpha n=1 Tax=Zooxanthella nutricula TaxID=1333877 RepID=A0A6U6P3V1_9DINO|mmetsp:Transcript_52127/g.158342  ORF Transcript_52127/g.158342 Transcript_52127/m.158342 type:complete len:547 (+) Transcript_52127:117-1757(+)
MAAAELGLSLQGERESGADVRSANVTAVMALSTILKSSLGPQGLDKMLVDDIGDVTITNDGATILKQLEVEHPAAKVLVELANLQDTEVGDGTTSVVIVAAELLKRANELVKNNIHPTTIIAGYRLAMRESIKYIQANLSVPVDKLEQDVLLSIAKTTLSSKFVGAESELFTKIVVDAMKAVKVVGPDGKAKYPVGQVNIIKSHGLSSSESMLIAGGYAIQLSRGSQEMPTYVASAKICLLDFDLKKHRMSMGVNIVIDDPEELERVRQKEMDLTKEKIKKIVDAGTTVLFTTKGIDDFAMKYLVDAGVMGVRRVSKGDIKRIGKCTGARLLLTMADMEGEETFDPACLGKADEVSEQRVGDNDFIFIKGCAATKAATILLRGANDFMLEEADRSVHDALCAVSRTLESNSVVPGGGAVETALSLHLEDYARKWDSYEQWAIAEFAEALLTIPKTLAINAALDAIDLLAALRVRHHAAQTAQDSKKDYKWYGLDLINNGVRNSVTAGVLEPMVSKLKSLKFATEAAITILRIDDLIRIAPEQEQPM